MLEITNPHDKFFKENFTHKEIAKDFLTTYLPHNILKEINIDTLSIDKTSFIEKELIEYFSDITYKVRLKNRTAYIYLLFEHKSYIEPKTAFYLLRNMVKLWELKIKQREIKKKLPVIIPLLIYHGKEKWKISREFIKLFGETEDRIKEYIPDFRYELYDISHLKDKEIKGEIKLKVLLLILKYIFREELKERLHDIFRLLKELEGKRSGIEYIETLLRYIASAADKIEKEDIDKAIKEIEGGEELMPTLAEKWVEEGERIGIEKGERIGIEKGIEKEKRLLLRLIERKWGEAGSWVREQLKSVADPDELETIGERILICDRVEDLFRKE